MNHLNEMIQRLLTWMHYRGKSQMTDSLNKFVKISTISKFQMLCSSIGIKTNKIRNLRFNPIKSTQSKIKLGNTLGVFTMIGLKIQMVDKY